MQRELGNAPHTVRWVGVVCVVWGVGEVFQEGAH